MTPICLIKSLFGFVYNICSILIFSEMYTFILFCMKVNLLLYFICLLHFHVVKLVWSHDSKLFPCTWTLFQNVMTVVITFVHLRLETISLNLCLQCTTTPICKHFCHWLIKTFPTDRHILVDQNPNDVLVDFTFYLTMTFYLYEIHLR